MIQRFINFTTTLVTSLLIEIILQNHYKDYKDIISLYLRHNFTPQNAIKPLLLIAPLTLRY